MFQKVLKNLRKNNDFAPLAASKWPQDGLKFGQDGLKFGQDGPKIGLRRLQDLPKTILKRFFLHLLFRLRC